MRFAHTVLPPDIWIKISSSLPPEATTFGPLRLKLLSFLSTVPPSILYPLLSATGPTLGICDIYIGGRIITLFRVR